MSYKISDNKGRWYSFQIGNWAEQVLEIKLLCRIILSIIWGYFKVFQYGWYIYICIEHFISSARINKSPTHFNSKIKDRDKQAVIQLEMKTVKYY